MAAIRPWLARGRPPLGLLVPIACSRNFDRLIVRHARPISSRSRDPARRPGLPPGVFSQGSAPALARSQFSPAWQRFFDSVGCGRRFTRAEMMLVRAVPLANSEREGEESHAGVFAGLCMHHVMRQTIRSPRLRCASLLAVTLVTLLGGLAFHYSVVREWVSRQDEPIVHTLEEPRAHHTLGHHVGTVFWEKHHPKRLNAVNKMFNEATPLAEDFEVGAGHRSPRLISLRVLCGVSERASVVRVCVCVCVCVCVHLRLCIRACTCVHACVCMRARACARAHTYCHVAFRGRCCNPLPSRQGVLLSVRSTDVSVCALCASGACRGCWVHVFSDV
jgi:hypothetical protein